MAELPHTGTVSAAQQRKALAAAAAAAAHSNGDAATTTAEDDGDGDGDDAEVDAAGFLHTESSDARLDVSVATLLADESFWRLGRNYDRTRMIKRSNAIGGPPLRLLPLVEVERLGRLPHSSEGLAQDAVQLIHSGDGPGRKEVFFVSHRWLRGDHPDAPGNPKARALAQFGQWRRAWVRSTHSFVPEILLWVDWACVDQDDPAPDLAKLPLSIACCERLVTFVADGYAGRGWCRVEQLLAKRFMFADHQTVIDAAFKNAWPYRGHEVAWSLQDPAAGALTCEADRAHIQRLTRLTRWHGSGNSRGGSGGGGGGGGRGRSGEEVSGSGDSGGSGADRGAGGGGGWGEPALKVFDLRGHAAWRQPTGRRPLAVPAEGGGWPERVGVVVDEDETIVRERPGEEGEAAATAEEGESPWWDGEAPQSSE